MKEITVDALLARARQDGECLIWTGYASQGRFPQWNIAGKVQPVRRLIYEAVHGRIRKGLQVGTACGNDLCVHPDCLVARSKSKAAPVGVPLAADRKARITRKRRARSNLTMEVVREIRASEEPGVVIEARLGLKAGYASRIRLNICWKDSANPFLGLGKMAARDEPS